MRAVTAAMICALELPAKDTSSTSQWPASHRSHDLKCSVLKGWNSAPSGHWCRAGTRIAKRRSRRALLRGCGMAWRHVGQISSAFGFGLRPAVARAEMVGELVIAQPSPRLRLRHQRHGRTSRSCDRDQKSWPRGRVRASSRRNKPFRRNRALFAREWWSLRRLHLSGLVQLAQLLDSFGDFIEKYRDFALYVHDIGVIALDAAHKQLHVGRQARVKTHPIAPIASGYGHLPLHLTTIFSLVVLIQQGIYMGRRIGALDFHEPLVSDQPIRRAPRHCNAWMVDECSKCNIDIAMKFISRTGLRFGIGAPLHGGVDESLLRRSCQSFGYQHGADIRARRAPSALGAGEHFPYFGSSELAAALHAPFDGTLLNHFFLLEFRAASAFSKLETVISARLAMP